MAKTCFFIGHREQCGEITEALEQVIERHITEYGVTEFVVGSHGCFDAAAFSALMDAKLRHPEISILELLTYHPAQRKVSPRSSFSQLYYPPGMERVPKRAAIPRANRYMVDHSDYLIAYVWHPASNAWELLEYARKRELKGLIKVVNLGIFREFPDPPSTPFGVTEEELKEWEQWLEEHG